MNNRDIIEKHLILDCFLAGCKRWNAMPKDRDMAKVYTDSPEKTLCGFVAEEYIYKYVFKSMVPSKGIPDVYNYDFLIFGRAKLEIKNKCVNSVPQIEYDVSINQYWVPDCHFFLFTRMRANHKKSVLPRKFKMTDTISDEMANKIAPLLLEKYSSLYLLGYLSKHEFLDSSKAKLVNRGDRLTADKYADGNTINRLIRDLNPFNKLFARYRSFNYDADKIN